MNCLPSFAHNAYKTRAGRNTQQRCGEPSVRVSHTGGQRHWNVKRPSCLAISATALNQQRLRQVTIDVWRMPNDVTCKVDTPNRRCQICLSPDTVSFLLTNFARRCVCWIEESCWPILQHWIYSEDIVHNWREKNAFGLEVMMNGLLTIKHRTNQRANCTPSNIQRHMVWREFQSCPLWFEKAVKSP